MKNLKSIILLLSISLFVFSGCMKDEIVPLLPKSLNELNADDTFTWTTANSVEIQITGLPTVIPVRSTLSILLSDGTNLYSEFHLMSENLSLNLPIPSSENQLVLKYGSMVYPLVISNGKVEFSFIPKIQ
jgi:hypothetical protein